MPVIEEVDEAAAETDYDGVPATVESSSSEDLFNSLAKRNEEQRVSMRLLVPKEFELYIKNKKDLPPNFLQKQLLMQSHYLNTNNKNLNAATSSTPSQISSSSNSSNNFSQLVLRLTREQANELRVMIMKLREQKKLSAEEYRHLHRMMFSFGRRRK
jgi:hypothetical protein